MADKQVNVIISAIDRLTAPAARMRAALTKLTEPLRATSSAVGRLSEATGLTALSGRFAKLGSSIAQTSGHVTGLAGKITALSGLSLGAGLFAGGAAAKSFVNTNAEFEQFLTSLTTLTGSSEKAQASMDWITEFATKTPYELKEVTSAFVKLKSYGFDAADGTLEKLGDMASSMSKPLDQAVEAFADAMTGEMERLKEFGVKSETKGDIVSMAFVDKDGRKRVFQAAKKDTAAMQKALLAIIDAKGFTGGMSAQSMTFNGIVSNLKDAWSGFQRAIGDAGAFDFLKSKLGEVLDKVNELSKNGTLKIWAKNISDALINLWVVIESKIMAVDWGAAWDGFTGSVSRAIEGIQSFVSFVGGWENALLVVVAVMNAGLIASIIGIGVQLAALLPAIIGFAATLTGTLVSALVAVSSAILLNPIGLAITAIVAAVAGLAYAIYENWEPLSAFVAQLLADITAAFNAAVAWLQALDLGAIGMAVINGLLTGIASAAVNLPRILSDAWNAIPGMVAQLWTDVTGLFDQAIAWFESIDLTAVGTGLITSILDGVKGAWAGLTSWIGGAMSSLSGMLPSFVRDQLGISAPAGFPVEAVPNVPAGPKIAQSNRQRSPIFAPPQALTAGPSAAPMPNVWDIVSGDAVPPRQAAGGAGAAPQVSAPLTINVTASGVTDVDALRRMFAEVAKSAIGDWQKSQAAANYGLLSD